MSPTDEQTRPLIEILSGEYGDERIERLNDTRSRGVSEVIVYESANRESPFLISAYIDRADEGDASSLISDISARISETGSKFGAVLAEDIRYIFEPQNDGYERTLPEYPDPAEERTGRQRPFSSSNEFVFCFKRLYNIVDREFDEEESRRNFCEIIRYIKEADESSMDAEFNAEFRSIANQIFNAYSIDSTERDVKFEFVNKITEIDGVQRFNTRNELADSMVDLAGIAEGDSILDPASGLGTILRRAVEEGKTAKGVEVDGEIAQSAELLNELLGYDVSITNRDFLDEYAPDETFDQIIMEPPSTRTGQEDSVESLVTQTGTHIEERFLESAGEYLKEGGMITALIPLGVLSRPDDETRELREYLLENYRIESIIEITNKRYYPYPGVRTAIIQLTKAPEAEYEVSLATIESKDTQDRFAGEATAGSETQYSDVISRVKSGEAKRISIAEFGDSFVPSDILRRQRIEDVLEGRFEEHALLEELVEEVQRGIEFKTYELSDSGVPYLRLTDVLESAGSTKYVEDPPEENEAGPSDLLISIQGTVGEIYRPAEPVVPSNDWAILWFGGEEKASEYERFLTDSDIGSEVREEIKSSALVPYPRYNPVLPVQRLERIPLPRLD